MTMRGTGLRACSCGLHVFAVSAIAFSLTGHFPIPCNYPRGHEPTQIPRWGPPPAPSALAFSRKSFAADNPDFAAIQKEIEKRHDEAVQRLQEWIRQPSIAAENRGMAEGCDLTMRMLRDAGFGERHQVPTDGQPGIFATLDAGAPRTVGLYFMYDVKQADPAEWSSPPLDAALVDKPGVGKVRGGPRRGQPERARGRLPRRAARHSRRRAQAAGEPGAGGGRRGRDRLAALPADRAPARGAGRAAQVQRRLHALRRAGSRRQGHHRRSAPKAWSNSSLSASGEKWGRGPRKDIHSSNKARVDSPAWHLVQALSTLVSPDGNTPAIEGFADKARPLSEAEKEMIAEAARRLDEKVAKKQLGVEHWVHDVGYQQALELLQSRPTVNIEGLVGGYTGPGGKTILPHRAVAKLDLRLVPDMTADEALAALKAHLAKHGFGDIEVNMTGGYDPNSTSADAALIRAQVDVLSRARESTPSCCRAAPARGPATSSPAIRCACPPATSAWATAAAPTRPTSTT